MLLSRPPEISTGRCHFQTELGAGGRKEWSRGTGSIFGHG